jgi:hypothetical protein
LTYGDGQAECGRTDGQIAKAKSVFLTNILGDIIVQHVGLVIRVLFTKIIQISKEITLFIGQGNIGIT